MTNAQDVKDLCRLLEIMTPRQRKFFLKTLNKEQMAAFEVAFFNLATNPKGLGSKDLATLRRYKRQIGTIASKNYNLSEKRKTINQRGGFLPAVLPILGTLLTSFLT